MTFTEAALEVLRRMGREMHARDIADKAVEWDLLSHVGKTPDQTMSARISAMVAKGPGKGPFVRVRPGVFALSSWQGKPPGPSEPIKVPEVAKAAAPRPEPKKEERSEGDRASSTNKEKENARPTRPRRGQKVDPAPETRPGPGGAEHPSGDAPQAEVAQAPRDSNGAAVGEEAPEGGRKRKRRRRKKKPEEVVETAEQQVTRTAAEEPVQRKPERDPAPNGRRVPVDEDELTDRVEDFLRKSTRPVPLAELAAHFRYEGPGGAPLMETILIADGLEREYRGLRSRFVQHRSGWSLAEREVSSEIVNLERQVSEAAERLGQLAERQMLRRLRNLPLNLFTRVVTLYLRRTGFGDLSPVEMGIKDEINMAVQDRRRGGRFRTAVVLRRDPPDRPLSDDVIASLRGSLHRYRSMGAMLITTGAFDEKARTEAVIPNLPPVALIDGEVLARELVRLGIGVRERKVSLPAFDEAFFSELGS